MSGLQRGSRGWREVGTEQGRAKVGEDERELWRTRMRERGRKFAIEGDIGT